MQRSGINPSYSDPTLRLIHSGIFSVMTNHEYGVPAYDSGKITEATIRARREVHAIVRDLLKLGGPWKDLAVVATAEQIGVREGRRVRGRATVTADDIVAGKKHEDAVCRVNFGFDVHNVRAGAMFVADDEIAAEVRRYRQAGSKPYDIPLGALIAADVDGLMMAGRCISGDFIAHSSYRVTGNAVPMGEAAGRAPSFRCVSGAFLTSSPRLILKLLDLLYHGLDHLLAFSDFCSNGRCGGCGGPRPVSRCRNLRCDSRRHRGGSRGRQRRA